MRKGVHGIKHDIAIKILTSRSKLAFGDDLKGLIEKRGQWMGDTVFEVPPKFDTQEILRMPSEGSGFPYFPADPLGVEIIYFPG